MTPETKKYFEARNSSLAMQQNNREVKWEDARNYACEDIAANITKVPEDLSGVIDYQGDFCFMVRVSTGSSSCKHYDYDDYMKEFRERHFISFSTITPNNISHYKSHYPFVLAYNMPADAIAHIFPYDSNTATGARYVDDLTELPSMWLTLDDLNDLTHEVGTYNQITCATKLMGEIIKPSAVICFDRPNGNAAQVATWFNLPLLVVHPNKDAKRYVGDALVESYNFLHLKNVLKDMLRANATQPKDLRALDTLMHDLDFMHSEFCK